MKVKANISFSGCVSMYKGEVRDIPEDEILQDLLKCEYVTEVLPEPQKGVSQKTDTTPKKAGDNPQKTKGVKK